MKKILLFLMLTGIISACGDDDTPEDSTLSLRFNVEYQGEPLVVYDNYTYTDGSAINFNRISTYISDLRIHKPNSSTLLKDVDFLRLDRSHESLSDAMMGFEYTITGIEPGEYSGISFDFGISPEDNAKKPADYESGHPLANSGEYWESWNSFIFVKFEGKIDSDGDNIPDQGFALHLGSDEARRSIQQEMTINLNSDTEIIVTIDLYDILVSGDQPYDLNADGQIHSLNQMPLITLLADNLLTNTKITQ